MAEVGGGEHELHFTHITLEVKASGTFHWSNKRNNAVHNFNLHEDGYRSALIPNMDHHLTAWLVPRSTDLTDQIWYVTEVWIRSGLGLEGAAITVGDRYCGNLPLILVAEEENKIVC